MSVYVEFIYTHAGRACEQAGIGRTLAPRNGTAAALVSRFAEKILEVYHFADQNIVLCLHNNGPYYSASNYLPGGDMANDAEDVYIRAGSDPHNFFFVTHRVLFDRLSNAELNVVLQSQTLADDGSLSYYSLTQDKFYVNVEARAEGGATGDQVIIQLDMIEQMCQVLFPT